MINLNYGKGVQTSALKHFTNFINVIRDDDKQITNWENLSEEELCSIETWKKFAHHLVQMVLALKITKNTAEVYLNSCKDAVRNKYLSNVNFKDNDENRAWQTKLVRAMMNYIMHGSNASLQFEKNKTPPIGNKGLKAISEKLLKRNDVDSIITWVGFVTGFEFASRSNELTIQHQRL